MNNPLLLIDPSGYGPNPLTLIDKLAKWAGAPIGPVEAGSNAIVQAGIWAGRNLPGAKEALGVANEMVQSTNATVDTVFFPAPGTSLKERIIASIELGGALRSLPLSSWKRLQGCRSATQRRRAIANSYYSCAAGG